MNGTVLPSSSSAITAATPLAGKPSVSASAGTGSKSSGSGGATSSVIEPANLAQDRGQATAVTTCADSGERHGESPNAAASALVTAASNAGASTPRSTS